MAYNIIIQSLHNNIYVEETYFANIGRGIILFNGYYHPTDSIERMHLIDRVTGCIYPIQITDHILCGGWSNDIIGRENIVAFFRIDEPKQNDVDDFFNKMVDRIVSDEGVYVI
jgi:hypothetical protein